MIINYEPITALKLHDFYILFLRLATTVQDLAKATDHNLHVSENDTQVTIRCYTCPQSMSAVFHCPYTQLSTLRVPLSVDKSKELIMLLIMAPLIKQVHHHHME